LGDLGLGIFYKIEKASAWQKAVAAGVYVGSALDLKDGFIHLSTAAQACETARLHFAAQTDLILVAIPETAVVANLKWEASRGGQLFPHVFGTLNPADALWTKPLPWTGAAHDFPAEFTA
jgi:uncharacterized protein (DUF952 family)